MMLENAKTYCDNTKRNEFKSFCVIYYSPEPHQKAPLPA